MSLRYYMDVHVPRPITRGLRLRGVDVLTSQDDGTTEWEDDKLLLRATELDRVMVSFDKDFERVVASFMADNLEFAGHIHIPHGKLTVGDCVTKLTSMAQTFDPDDIWNTQIQLAQW